MRRSGHVYLVAHIREHGILYFCPQDIPPRLTRDRIRILGRRPSHTRQYNHSPTRRDL